MRRIAEFTDANFDREVLRADRPVLVDFWAETCAPCRLMVPVLSRLDAEIGTGIKVGRMNVFENPRVTEALAIKGIPYTILVRAGEVILEMMGDHSVQEIRSRIDAALETPLGVGAATV